jgi:hypothetical protein
MKADPNNHSFFAPRFFANNERFAEVLNDVLGEKRKCNFSKVTISTFVQDPFSPFVSVATNEKRKRKFSFYFNFHVYHRFLSINAPTIATATIIAIAAAITA